MKKVTLAVFIGMLVGALAGALILGVQQYFNERHQSDWSEIEQWVFIATLMGTPVGAVAGAFIGLVVGIIKAKSLR